MKRLLLSLFLASTALALAGIPETAAVIRELKDSQAARAPAYLATWHSEDGDKTLDITIAEEAATGRFLLHMKMAGPGKTQDVRQWSPDGKLLHIDQDGNRITTRSAAVGLDYMLGFARIFSTPADQDAPQSGPDFLLRFRTSALLSGESVICLTSITPDDQPPWTGMATDLSVSAVDDYSVSLTSPEFGVLTFDRENGLLTRQEVAQKDGNAPRVLKLTRLVTKDVPAEMDRTTAEWSILGAEEVGLTPWNVGIRLQFFQSVIRAIEQGAASLEKLEEKLAGHDELMAFARQSLALTVEPGGAALPWDKILAFGRDEARRRWKAALPAGEADDEKSFTAHLTEPANRNAIRDGLVGGLMQREEEIMPPVLFAIFGPRMDDGLAAKTPAGRVAKAVIEKALVRAYLTAKLEEKMAVAWGEREDLD